VKYTIFLLFLLLLTCGCSDSTNETVYFEKDIYVGFEDADTNLSRQKCIDLDFVVVEGILIQENYDRVQEFIDRSSEGNTNRLRIATFRDDEGPSYRDLVFDKGLYYFYYMDQENLNAEDFDYLLILEGQWGLPVQDYKMLVVSDDETLTFDEVNKVMVSSSMEYINSVGRHRIVLFNY